VPVEIGDRLARRRWAATRAEFDLLGVRIRGPTTISTSASLVCG